MLKQAVSVGFCLLSPLRLASTDFIVWYEVRGVGKKCGVALPSWLGDHYQPDAVADV